jgi:hypothetical protein
MNYELIRPIIATERRRTVLLVLVWSAAISSILAQALFRGTYPTVIDYSLLAASCIIAGALMLDVQKALLGYLAAMIIGLLMLFFLATLPAIIGEVAPPGDSVVYMTWSAIIFRAVFPIPLVTLLVASILGSFLGERFLD